MSQLFESVISDAGIPNTEADLTTRFRQIATEESVVFNNASAYSPFWRLVLALVVKPVMWLLGVMTNQVLPNLYLKTASGEWLDLYAWSVDVTRKPATKAKGLISLRRSNSSGTLAITAGVVVLSAPINGVIYRLISTEYAEFLEGETVINVAFEAEKTGEAYNLSDGFYALLETSIAGIVQINNTGDWLMVPGASVESDDDLRLRCRNQFSAVNRWHVDAAYKAMIAQWPGISVDDIFIQHDAPRGAGTANAYILFDADAPSSTYLTQITDYLTTDGNHGLGDDVQVLSMPTTPIDIVLTVVVKANTADIPLLQSSIENFIKTAFREIYVGQYSPTVVKPNARFVWSQLIAELHAEFIAVESLDFTNDADIVSTFNVPYIDTLMVNIS